MSADRRQGRQPIRRLPGGPGDAAEDKDAEQGIIEGPGEVPGDGDEDPAAAGYFARPHEGARFAVLDALSQDVDLCGVAGEVPVALVDELEVFEIAGDGMVGVREAEVERSVAEGGLAAAPGEA